MKKQLKRHGSLVATPDALAAQEAWKKSLFEKACAPGSNVLLKGDLIAVLEKLHIPPSRVDEIFSKVDVDGDGKIDYGEFSNYVDGHEAQLRASFASLDVDGSGQLSKAEIQQLLDRQQVSCSPAKLDEIFGAMDRDKSGKINYEEYRSFFALLDPNDLLRSLDDSASFGDLPGSMVADTKVLARRLSVVRPADGAAAPPKPAAQPTSPLYALATQLLPGGIAGVMAQTIVRPHGSHTQCPSHSHLPLHMRAHLLTACFACTLCVWYRYSRSRL